MIDIKVDFKQDYYNYIFHEVGLLREAGFSFPKIRNDNTYEIAEYNNLIERIPFQIPRKIFKTKSQLMKTNKGSGKSIVAAARKMAEIVWAMLSDKKDFDAQKMIGKYKPMSLAEKTFIAMN